ncbi:unnamed protein product [Brassicogethes aeneus]|uniref:CHK kinase-like domain-containing protein n=1 Tax=Brassicogethes aeneus TaxID=1431903 RepID=A0A9P0FEV8_BRAAE|nr:unnamed protein product [Brassicogethes aeneus]
MDQISKFGISDQDIKILIKSIFKKKNDLQVDIVGTSKLDEGCTGIIIYVKATDFQSKTNEKFNFVVKHSSTNVEHKKQIPITWFYKIEAYLYETIVPILQKYLTKKNVELLYFFPKFYKSQFWEDKEIIVFENIKPKGYKLHNVKIPMDLNHIKLVLSEYAKWHSTSYSFKIENPEVWKSKVKYINDIKVFMFDTFPGVAVFKGFQEKYCEILEKCSETKLLDKMKKLDFIQMKKDSFIDDEYSVVIHDDCWNNNYLFKYKDDTDIPENVSILDWQMACFGHLEVDIAEMLFSCISSENLKDIDELLDTYYEMFSQNLCVLGINSSKMYPKTLFLSHWKSCLKYGIISLPFIYAKAIESEKNVESMEALLANKDGHIYDVFDSEVSNSFVNRRIIHLLKYLDDKKML